MIKEHVKLVLINFGWSIFYSSMRNLIVRGSIETGKETQIIIGGKWRDDREWKENNLT